MNRPTAVGVHDRKYAWSVGIDWAEQKHDLCQRCWADGQRQQFQIGADPASVGAWLKELKTLARPQNRVAIGFEQKLELRLGSASARSLLNNSGLAIRSAKAESRIGILQAR